MTASTFVNVIAATNSAAGSTSPNWVMPTVLTGDICGVVLHCSQLTQTLTAPANWTIQSVGGAAGDQAGGNNTLSYLLTHTVLNGATESGTTVTGTFGTFTRWAASGTVRRGGVHDSVARATHGTLNANLTTPAVTPPVDECTLVSMSGISFASAAGSNTFTPAGTYTERTDNATSTTGVNVGTYVASRSLSTSTAGVLVAAVDHTPDTAVTHRDNTYVWTVAPSATPLVADAGVDQTVAVNTTVTLTATATPGTPTLTWTQTGGTPTVTLNGSGGTVTFTAPSSATVLTFQAEADDGVTTDTDTMTVTVIAAAVTERAHATAFTRNGWNTSLPGLVIPTETRTGDGMLLHWAGGGAAGPVTDPVTLGWTLVATSTDSNITGTLWKKVAGVGDAGSHIFDDIQTTQRIACSVLVLANTDTTDPVSVAATPSTEVADTTTHTAASLTTATTGRIVRFLALRDDGTKSTTRTPPADVTLLSDTETGDTTFGVVSTVAMSAAAVVAGTYTGNWTVDQSSPTAVMLAVGIAAGAGGAASTATRFLLSADSEWIPLVTEIL